MTWSLLQRPPHVIITLFRPDLNVSDSSNRRHSFSTKAKRANRMKVMLTRDLAGGMTDKRKLEVILRHARSIINDVDELLPSVTHDHGNACRTCIYGVLNKFFND
jgi:hypothetical protein